MTDHPLTETAAAELWDASRDPGCPLTDRYEEMRRAAASAYEDMAQVTRPENHEKCLNAALSAALPHLDAATPTRLAGTPEPLPCGCENPFNAVHLLDH